MQFEKIIQLLLAKRGELSQSIYTINKTLGEHKMKLKRTFFWRRKSIRLMQEKIESVERFQNNLMLRLRSVDRLWQTLACPQEIVSSLSDTMVVLSMWLGTLTDEEILEIFGAVAVRNGAEDFQNSFDICGKALCYVDEDKFKTAVELQASYVNPGYTSSVNSDELLTQELDQVKSAIFRAVRVNNCKLFESLTDEEKDEVDAYLSPNNKVLRESNTEDYFIAFCESVFASLNESDSVLIMQRRKECFEAFKNSFAIDKDALTQSSLKRRRQDAIVA